METKYSFMDMVNAVNNRANYGYPLGHFGTYPVNGMSQEISSTPYTGVNDGKNLKGAQITELESCFNPLFVKCVNNDFEKTYFEKFKQRYSNDIERLKKLKDVSVDAELLYAKVFSKLGNGNVKPCVTKKFDASFFPEGLINGNVYTITAQSGGGKTALAVNITSSLMIGFNSLYDAEVRDPSKVIYISLEQTKAEIRSRILAAISGIMDLENALSTEMINAYSIPNECMSLYETALNIYRLFEDNLLILDKVDFKDSLTIENILKVVEEKNEIFNAKLVILDQIVNVVSENMDCDNETPMEIKSYCQRTQVPFIVITQMNKASKQANRHSNVGAYSGADIRGSSVLEHQSSNILVFQLKVDEKGNSLGVVDVRSVKSRYGLNSTISLKFHGKCNLFEDLDVEEEIIKEDKGVYNYGQK